MDPLPVRKGLVEMLSEPSEDRESEQDDTTIPLCDPCAAGDEHNLAVNACIDCKESLCEACVGVHRKYKIFKGHNLVESSTQYTKDIAVDIKCENHGDRGAEIHCMDHNVYSCFGCIENVHPDCTGIKEITDMSGGSTKPMANLKQKFEITEKHLEHLLVGQQGATRKLSDTIDTMHGLLKQRKDEIMRTLDDLQSELTVKKTQLITSTDIEVQLSIERVQTMKLQCRQNIDTINYMHTSAITADTVDNALVQKDMIKDYIRIEKELDTEDMNIRELDVEWPVLAKLATIHQKMVSCRNKALAVVRRPSEVIKHEEVLKQLRYRRVVKTGEHTVNQNTCKRVVKKEEHSVSLETGWFPIYTGITPVNQYLLLCDNCGGNSSCGHVRLYDPKSESVSKLKINKPFGAAVLKSNPCHIAISVPKDKHIHIAIIKENTMTIVKTLQLDKTPYSLFGLDNGHIGVTMDSPPSFDIVDVTGSEMKTVTSYTQDSTGRKFKSFQYVAVDELRSHIIQPCTKEHAVYCFDMSGNSVFEYRDAELRKPRGVDIDRDGNIYVCSYNTGTLHVLSPSGRKLKVIKEGIPGRPQAICFDETRERFWVTSCLGYNNDKVCLFSFQD